MLDIQKILKRSWHILWSYRTLWIFGFILALSMGGANIGNNSRYTANDSNNNQPNGIDAPDGWQPQGDTFAEKVDSTFEMLGKEILKLQEQFPVEFKMGIAVAITLFVVILVLSIVTAILRYVAEAASIRMVDEYEQSGVKVGFRQGWKYGWSREAWRLFLVHFLVNLPQLVVFVEFVLIGWWIFSAFMGGVESAMISSIIAGSGLVFLTLFVVIILMVVLNVLRDFAWRMVVLEGKGVMESLRMAAALVKRNWKSVGLMWLVMIGVNIAFGIAFLIVIFPLLIISIVTALGGAAAAVIPSLLTAGIASLLSVPDYWPWVFAAIVGLPFFFVVTFSPILLVSGWGLIFQSSTWTLTYRELTALETVTPAAAEQA